MTLTVVETLLAALFGLKVLNALWSWFWQTRRKPVPPMGQVDAIVPAYNEEECVSQTVEDLVANPYIGKVICVNDGSTDGTAWVLEALAERYPGRVLVVHQENRGKARAIEHGLQYVSAPFVFLTDADTRIPVDDGLGHMIALMGRDPNVAAVNGVSATYLKNAPVVAKVRASVKFCTIAFNRLLQEAIGGSPFCISGACGLFRTDVLREVGIPTRTHVEDLDLTWTLVRRGYRVRQSAKAAVYTREASTVRAEYRRWVRWITGYSLCMRIHWPLFFSRFGIVVLTGPLLALIRLPLFVVLVGFLLYTGLDRLTFWHVTPTAASMLMVGSVSAYRQRRWAVLAYVPLAPLVTLMSSFIWWTWGLWTLIVGREPKRDKPVRY